MVPYPEQHVCPETPACTSVSNSVHL
jgi:hypothetical protein